MHYISLHFPKFSAVTWKINAQMLVTNISAFIYMSWGKGSWKIAASGIAPQSTRKGELLIQEDPQAMDSKEQTKFKVVYPHIALVLLQFMGRHKKP